MKFYDRIYIDSNRMFLLKVGASDTDFLALKNWVNKLGIKLLIPETVYLEWKQQHLDNLSVSYQRIGDDLRTIQLLTNNKMQDWIIPNDYEQKLDVVLNARLQELGIGTIPTPDNLTIEELVRMAVKKIKPFEEKKEKGFRDTVILRSITEDMKVHHISNATLVTNDLVFKDKDVEKYLKESGIELAICKDFNEATGRISAQVDEVVKEIVKNEHDQLKNFVETHTSKIFKFVRDNAEISEDFVTRGGLLSSKTDIYGDVQSVTSFEPVRVKDVFTGLRSIRLMREKEYTDKQEPISISVEVRIKVIYLPVLLFNRPTVKVEDLPRFKEASSNAPVQYYGEPLEKELFRSITVQGVIEKDQTKKYSKLELEKVVAY